MPRPDDFHDKLLNILIIPEKPENQSKSNYEENTMKKLEYYMSLPYNRLIQEVNDY